MVQRCKGECKIMERDKLTLCRFRTTVDKLANLELPPFDSRFVIGYSTIGYNNTVIEFDKDGTIVLTVCYTEQGIPLETEVKNKEGVIVNIDNDVLDNVGFRLNMQKRFNDDRLSYHVGTRKDIIINGEYIEDGTDTITFEQVNNGYRLLYVKRVGSIIVESKHIPVISRSREGLMWFLQYGGYGIVEYVKDNGRYNILLYINGVDCDYDREIALCACYGVFMGSNFSH